MKSIIVAVHGVGETAVGDTVSCLARVIDKGRLEAFLVDDLQIGDHTYARRRSTNLRLPELVEVNWSDLQRPKRSLVGFLRHLLAVAFAMLNLDYRWLGRPSPLRLQGLYRFALECLAAWAVYPVLLGLGNSSLKDLGFNAVSRGIFVLALAAVVACLLAVAWNWSRWLRLGGLVCLAVVALSGTCLLTGWVGEAPFNQASAAFYGGTQFAVIVLLLVVALEISVRIARRQLGWEVGLSHMAMNYVPLVLLSIFGACIWALVLSALDGMGGISPRWSKTFLEYVGFDVWVVEWCMAGVIICMTALGLIGLALYLIARRRGSSGSASAGSVARNWLRNMLIVIPVLLLGPGVAMVLTSPVVGYGHDTDTLLQLGVVTIYTVSAVRAVALFPLAIPRLVPLLDVVGDVCFFATSPGTSFSSREHCKRRLRNLLDCYRNDPEVGGVCVVAHSQGSVIAYDVLRELPPTPFKVTLVMMGCPYRTLYGRFLGLAIDSGAGHQMRLYNLYREADYIGGPVNLPGAKDVPIGKGGHVGYWSDAAILPYLCLELDDAARARGEYCA